MSEEYSDEFVAGYREALRRVGKLILVVADMPPEVAAALFEKLGKEDA